EKHDLALIIEEMLKQRYQGVKNEQGVWITPAFPKLIYVLEEDNVREGTEYFYLTELAARCTAKRLVPDYISEKVMKELKEGNCFPVMGCRSCLSPWKDENGKYQFYGRFNQGVVTINLVDVALSSGGDMDRFWKVFDERLDLCYRALMCRHNRLKGTLSDAAPILWQYGALARLKKGEPIDRLLYGGYSTISLGYAGLCECVKYMTGKSHTDPAATPFAMRVMEYMNEACAKWREETDIYFSIYGSPIESTTYKFAKCLQRRFGIIEGVTDKGYITNSYHVKVTEEINAFDKLKFESQFQALSTGGAISYVEVPNMQDNIPAVLAVMQYIYENIMYAELNTKSDYCQKCGYDGEIRIIEESGKLIWECPHCHNRDQDTMNVARRTCGYIGTQFWNQGRTQEIRERVMHL
ncbi:MAG: anaerobic ribonucleoside-triphosphate reductase, partial [Eubacteriales bacterium]|nr:anaerobic ribonucleoside-triphosphate reductase [Eubacteriales bacterium]